MNSINALMSLQGKTALITGASGHLGQVISETLGELGAKLILADRDQDGLEKMAEKVCRVAARKTSIHILDLENEKERSKFVDEILTTNENLNILVNNAAFVGSSNLEGWSVPFEAQSLETWRRAIEVNLTAPFHLVQKLSPLMKRSEGASIINIGSIYGTIAPDWTLYEGTNMANPAAYAVSKAGLHQLTKWLASTLAPEIRVNGIAPGGIYRKQPEVFVNRYKKKVALGRMAVERDFVGAVVFLATKMSEYVSGTILSIDGMIKG